MTQSETIVTAWNNGAHHSSGAGYGVKLTIKDRPQYNPLVAWIGAPGRLGEALPAGETWPICTAMGSLAADFDWAPLDPDFAAGKKALAAEDWSAAIAALNLASMRDPENADIQNYIG